MSAPIGGGGVCGRPIFAGIDFASGADFHVTAGPDGRPLVRKRLRPGEGEAMAFAAGRRGVSPFNAIEELRLWCEDHATMILPARDYEVLYSEYLTTLPFAQRAMREIERDINAGHAARRRLP